MSVALPLSEVAAPRFVWVPSSAVTSAGAEVADLAASFGFQVDEPERLTLDTLLAETRDGRWAALESAVICGRQNLKTWALEMTVINDAFLRGAQRVVWTSHVHKTSVQAFRDLAVLVEAHEVLSRRVLKVRIGKGEEGFELRSGGRIDFLARTGRSGRGLTGDTVIIDEALYANEAVLGALLPTLSSRPNPAIRYGSSAGLVTSDVLRRLRDRGRSGSDESIAYLEYSSLEEPCADPMCTHEPATAGCLLDDEERWRAGNPALGRRISVDYVRAERRALPAVEFARERMGWWVDPPREGADQAVPAESWAQRLDPESSIPVGARVAFAVDTSWDRQTTWVAIAGMRADGVPHVEVVMSGFGPEWVPGWLEARVKQWNPVAVGLQSGSAPAGNLLEPLRQAPFGGLVQQLHGQDMARACGGFWDAVVVGPLAHLGQDPLDHALAYARSRPLSDAWVWDRKLSPVDVAPLVAVTQALYLLRSTEPPPPKVESYAPRRLR